MVNTDLTILIADRNRHIREFLQRELKAEGYKTLLSSDGREVLQILQSAPPNLLILDLEMPYVDGETVLEYLHKSKRKLPVIVHAFSLSDRHIPRVGYPVSFIEKGGTTIDTLKTEVARLLGGFPPQNLDREKTIIS